MFSKGVKIDHITFGEVILRHD